MSEGLINMAFEGLFGADESTAAPARAFAVPPYRAELFRKDSQIGGVMNANGINCLTFADKPGATLAEYGMCQRIAERWNQKNG